MILGEVYNSEVPKTKKAILMKDLSKEKDKEANEGPGISFKKDKFKLVN